MTLSLTITSDLELVAWVGLALRTICQSLGYSELQCGHLELCVVEAATNCVAHAYGESQGPIQIDFSLLDEGLRVRIWDEGRCMPEDLLERSRSLDQPDPDDLVSLSDHGRGLFIIQELMSRVTYQQVDGRNRLEFYVTKGEEQT